MWRKKLKANASILQTLACGDVPAVLLETGPSFAGLVPPPPAASRGRMVDEARRFSARMPWGRPAVAIRV